ncbi:PatB family C-S lyase [Rubinisphaera sp.]|uniref:MalY/PatB family protein n=1 Tax=Rubinisphaera sp. TaxID=2024857 RepID=UPI000C0DA417|nr:PatB family C-S lyase [Rubinisphaera sp.]MBV11993.1 aspartate aminotransferase [Rubinisphaera sp.]HCS55095.1 aspartate aminotransferase [Planctomycetaceae bacterium]|tara:strand:- start:4576 stop:5757 length:1182 start_codon:yes stop_codon:yes gene_type:complete
MSETDFDFHQLPERRGTGSIKWERYPDYIPYWVADMDFASPDCVVEAMQHRVEHGVFGYAHPHRGLIETVLDYLSRADGVQVSDKSLVHLPGMVPALSQACRAFCQPGDQVMINSPVYYPFFKVAADAGASVIDIPHIRDEVTWRFDWEAMENAVTSRTKVLILCNPQNPLGRVFSEEEILKLAEFCQRHELVLVADEIHCDLILEPEQVHYSALKLPKELRKQLITLKAPSKTYNIAGLGYSFAVIEDDQLRSDFNRARGCTLPEINVLAMVAAEAAYRDGEPWRRDLIEYLRENRDALASFIRQEMPVLKIHEHAATYLYWINCSELNVSNPCQFFAKEAGVFLTDGEPFGSRQHVRFNFGCPRDHMLVGLQKMKGAIDQKLASSSGLQST